MPIPSGFKTKEEWNNYQKEYRTKKAAKDKIKGNHLAFLELENQRLNKCIQHLLN